MGSAASSRPEWKPLIVCLDPARCAALRSALEDLGISDYAHLLAYPQPESALSLAARHQANIVFLDVGSNPDSAMELLGLLAGTRPVVALNSGPDAENVLRCLRRGAAEFVSDPITAGQVSEVLQHLERSREGTGERKLGSVYTLVPGKPGSGASTLAAYLALEIARRKPGRVLLADFDLLAGTIGFLLKVRSDFHVEHAAEDSKRMDEDLWRKLVTPCHGVDVLPAPESPSRENVAPEAAEEILSFTREHYDTIILDTPGAGSPVTLPLARLADAVLVATTGDMPALYASARSVVRLEASGLPRGRVRAVVNRHSRAVGLSRRDLAAALRLEAAAVLAEDRAAVQLALLEGRAVPWDSRLGRGIAALACSLENRDEPPRPRASLLSLLRPRWRKTHSTSGQKNPELG
jgi:pilus assembly protein CpaE